MRFALQEIGQQTQDDDAVDQLAKLPHEFGNLIQRQLVRIGKDLPTRKVESLRFLLQWVAHARRPLSVQEARAVVLLKTTYSDYAIEKEVQVRFAGIILLHNSNEVIDLEDLSAERNDHLPSSRDDFMDDPEDIALGEPSDNVVAISGARDAQTSSLLIGLDTSNQAISITTSTAPSSETAYITLKMEESIVDYFQAVSWPTSGLITNSSDARADLATTTMGVYEFKIKVMDTI